MAATLTLVGKTPGQTQFGLDTFTEHYKCDATADVVLTDPDVPQKGSAHPDYDFMFLTDRYCSETSESASALDLVYMGCLTDDGEGNPILPAGQSRTGNPVQTATTFATDGTTQVTVQFYSVLSQLTFITYGAAGTTGSAPAPSGTPTVITFTVGSATFSAGEAELLSLFQLTSTDIIDSTEIVAGKFWQNNEQRTLYYGANVTVCRSFAARAVCLFAAGTGYSVSDNLTCTDLSLNTAVMVVTAVGLGGEINDFTISSDDISAPIFLVITATGGGGSGASFRFYGA